MSDQGKRGERWRGAAAMHDPTTFLSRSGIHYSNPPDSGRPERVELCPVCEITPLAADIHMHGKHFDKQGRPICYECWDCNDEVRGDTG